MDDYPFVRCLHPRKVYNRYTHKSFMTGCGVCKACLLQRQRRMSMQCSIEEQHYRYAMFVTLTFDSAHLPVCRVEPSYIYVRNIDGYYDKVQNGYVLINQTERDGRLSPHIGDVFGYVNYDKSQMSMMLDKCHVGRDLIPYASLYDYQTFLKRFRKQLNKYTDEKIRYYGVSEYGPIHFRPHYHFIFYFDSAKTLQAFAKCLRASWTFGRVDSSLSRSKVSSYVSGYLNSRVSLPRLFTLPSFRPFSSHSVRFAQGFLQGQKEKIYENGPEYFARLSVPVGANVVEFMPWRSLASRYFPKCRNYNSLSLSELYTAYTILSRARSDFGSQWSLTQLSELIVNSHILNTTTRFFLGMSPLVSLYSLNEFKDDEQFVYKDMSGSFYFRSERSELVKLAAAYINFEDYRPDAQSVYRDLLLSKHFIEFVCDGRLDYQFVMSRIRKICDYYNYIDYCNLTDWYQKMSDYADRRGPRGLINFYDFEPGQSRLDSVVVNWLRNNTAYSADGYTFEIPGFSDSLENDVEFQVFRSLTDSDFEKSIKHKKLNDMNNIFNF